LGGREILLDFLGNFQGALHAVMFLE